MDFKRCLKVESIWHHTQGWVRWIEIDAEFIGLSN
jgi:hypothetical protein